MKMTCDAIARVRFPVTVRGMKFFVFLIGLLLTTAATKAAELLPIEKQVAEAAQDSKPTVVHFWAPWCSNCYGELKNNGWTGFINAHPNVNFIFITSWTGENGDGREMLEKLGLGKQKNFRLLLHPNASRRDEDKMNSFLGLPVAWLPATWIFKDGKLRYALNYGEIRFPLLQQLVKDTLASWD
jgi:thiol-disulfide isomerase/thioredoxin